MMTLKTKIKKNERLFSDEDLIAYEKHSLGAFELHSDYIVIYKNWLPFRNFIKGRIMHVINLKDIDQFAYKGTGWFGGILCFSYKHFSRPRKFNIFVWWVWRRFKFNNNLTPVFDYISKFVMNAWKSENYRVIETTKEVMEKGICPQCGGSITNDDVFCPQCGNKIK